MAAYLDAAFTTPRDLLGYDNPGQGKIDIYFREQPGSARAALYQAGANQIELNLAGGLSPTEAQAQQWGAAIAHETTHLLFSRQTGFSSQSPWLEESLAYYVADAAYPNGQGLGKNAMAAGLAGVGQDSRQRQSWYASGLNYAQGRGSDLEAWQFRATGYFLASRLKASGLKNLLTSLARGGDLERSLSEVGGMASGQGGTMVENGGGTLYMEYVSYYFPG